MKDKLDLLVAEVRKIAAKRPLVAYEHDDCYYDAEQATDGSVGCIFGQGLTAIGWKITASGDGRTISGLLENHGYDVKDDRVLWCQKVQWEQDGGECWGDSVRLSDD